MREREKKPDRQRRGNLFFYYLPAAALASVVAAIQIQAGPNNDVAWLLTLAQKLLTGARPDIDFIEFNPPAAYLIYVPAAALAHLLGLSADLVLVLLVVAGAAISVCAAGYILLSSSLVGARDLPVLAFCSLVALLLFADSSFAQREHIALIASLPMLAVYACRAKGFSPGFLASALSGIGGGVCVCIKPYFALALLLPLSYAIWRARAANRNSIKVLLSPENVSAALVLCAYAIGLAIFFLNYFRLTLPIVVTVYLPVREPLLEMLTGVRFVTFVLLLAGALLVGRANVRSSLCAVLLLAAAGFMIAVFLQARIWFYQGYPALALVMTVTGVLALERWKASSGSPGRVLSVATIAVCLLPSLATLFVTHSQWIAEVSSRQLLAKGLKPLLPEHPKVIAISREYAFVPIARLLDGVWSGRTYFQIITLNVDEQMESRRLDDPSREKLRSYAQYDAAILSDDIRRKRPDVVLIDGESDRSWALSQSPVKAALERYRQVGKIERAFVWLPKREGRSAD